MDTTDSNTEWQFPIVLLLDDLRADDAHQLAHLDAEQQAAHHRARELLRDYAQHVLDTAEADGRHWLTESGVANWQYLRDLMTVLLGNTEPSP
ncbi:MAG: hypothetical protein GEV00_16950 [Actinophytocola sp.]|nr:hypothetical protein [Actinophytocola sp.]